MFCLYEKRAQFLRYSKNAMSVFRINKFERHGRGTADRVEITAGGTETAFASKWNSFKGSAMFAAKKCKAEVKIAAMKHFLNILINGITNSNTAKIKSVEMVIKNLLKNIHVIIIPYTRGA